MNPKALFQQLPIAASAALDEVLWQHRAALQKFRQGFRTELGIDPRCGQVSLGRYGTILLEPSAVLPCVQTALRWSRAEARTLCHAYRDAGLDKLIASPEYGRMMKLTTGAVRDAVRAAPADVDFASLVKETVSHLVINEPVVRNVTREMERISEIVDRQVPQLRRRQGTLVRIEGPGALVSVERDGREELRSVDASLLQAVGIRTPGDPFIVSELHWSPDTVSSVYLPAVAIDDDEVLGEEMAAALEAAQKPLVFPG